MRPEPCPLTPNASCGPLIALEHLRVKIAAELDQLREDMEEIGVGLYRSHITFLQDAVGLHTWGDHALPRLNERIKQALDPNGIIAPGKQGIGSWS